MAQQAPTKGQEIVWPWAFDDLRAFVDTSAPDLEPYLAGLTERLTERVEEGGLKYGTYLMTKNGRDALQDAWEEAADLQFYLAQAVMELNEDVNRPDGALSELFEVQELAQEALLLLHKIRSRHGC